MPTPEVQALAAHLARGWGGQIRLGTSSWHFPGWAGLVWARAYSEAVVAKHGLAAYAQHPLLGTVSLNLDQWIICWVAGLSVLLVSEIKKRVYRKALDEGEALVEPETNATPAAAAA